jgi:hypothetical protein
MLKSKIFRSDFVDIELEVMETGWIILRNEREHVEMSLGVPENSRIELIEKAINYARKIKEIKLYD